MDAVVSVPMLLREHALAAPSSGIALSSTASPDENASVLSMKSRRNLSIGTGQGNMVLSQEKLDQQEISSSHPEGSGQSGPQDDQEQGSDNSTQLCLSAGPGSLSNYHSNPEVQRRDTKSRQRRERLLVLVRILMKCLEKEGVEPSLRIRAKETVRECTKRNREGDPAGKPLVDVIETRLREVVGEARWDRALHYLRRYEALRQNRRSILRPSADMKTSDSGRLIAGMGLKK